MYTYQLISVILTGIAITGRNGTDNLIVARNILSDYSYINIPEDNNKLIARCLTGLGPAGNNNNSVLSGWYFNGSKIYYNAKDDCGDPPIQQRSRKNDAGVVNLRRCGTFSTSEEGIYSCVMLNSSMVNQTMRLGVYFSIRSESNDQGRMQEF